CRSPRFTRLPGVLPDGVPILARVRETLAQTRDDLRGRDIPSGTPGLLPGSETAPDELLLESAVADPLLDGIDDERRQRLALAEQTLGFGAEPGFDAERRKCRRLHPRNVSHLRCVCHG